MGVTYKLAGVDIQSAGIFKAKIKDIARSSFRHEVLKDIGGFGSFFSLAKGKYREPVLVSSSDGVGTKLKIANLLNKHDTVGIDAVAMNVNDILCTGAEPLFFLDYIAYTKVKESVLLDVVKGINYACLEAGCSLIGGETAQMPGFYRRGEYDIAGFCVGVVEKKNIIDGSRMEPGDLAIGLESNGLHSNGYSLARKVLSEKEIKRMGKELLKPTRIYVKPILSLLRDKGSVLSGSIKGISHITGGAFYDKISRIIPDNINLRINKGSWPVPPIFRLIQNKGKIQDKEMFHTLNMGIGLVLVSRPESARRIISRLSELNVRSWIIGEATKGNKQVEII
ncbi:MAG: phosphoribosylformylglycinamidine cyclo-ligase [Candidatus Omnitrophota bacterium]